MNQQELLEHLHKYTLWEIFHKNNHANIKYIDKINNSLENPLNEKDKKMGIHFGNFPKFSQSDYLKDFFFKQNQQQDILVIQHDRYTPPVVHKHDFYELVYIYEGEFVHKIDNAQFLMHTGDICLIPPDVYHSLDVCNYSIVLNILVQENTFKNLLFTTLKDNNILSKFFLNSIYSKNVNDYIIFHTNGDLKIRNIILDMCLETINKEKYYTQILHTNLLLLLGLVLRYYEKNCDLPLINKKKELENFKIITYIEEHYATVTLESLSQIFHYSPQSISHKIKKITGKSFMDYILQKKMQMAASLLINTNIKIKNISEEIGYQNSEHFIRLFKKYFGKSPSIYRQLNQE